jgi:Domain of Unknown Function with PDB structure (DUF3857)
MKRAHSLAVFASLTIVIATCQAQAVGKDAPLLPDWIPATPAELTLKDCPESPGAPAMILDRQETIDDVARTLTVYVRIKIFRDKGMKYADVEIPYTEKHYEIAALRARTVLPSGRVIDFQGQAFDRMAVRKGKTRVHVKSFTLSVVEPGSIVEYMYQMRWDEKLPDVLVHPDQYRFEGALILRTTSWIISHELFTQRATFKFRPVSGPGLAMNGQGLVSAQDVPIQADGSRILNARNIPAAVEEESMPPQEVVQSRIVFFYTAGYTSDPATLWGTWARGRADEVENFIGKPKLVEKEVQKIISPGDTPETKLRKLYARAQQIRLLSFEHFRSEAERKKENLKGNKNVQDVLERGYALGNEVNYLFVALCRAAGFSAHVVLLESRDFAYFTKDYPDFSLLNALVVRVRDGSKEYFLDPATLFCPFNLLPWEESAAGGILLEPRSSSTFATYAASFVVSTTPKAADAVTARHATLTLDTNGALSGTLDVDFNGQEALQDRLAYRDKNESARIKALEKRVKGWLPLGAFVELKNKPDWETGNLPLHAVFDLKVPGFASSTRKRLLLPPLVFSSGNYPFQKLERTYPIDLGYPYQVIDDVTIALPQGYRVEALPERVQSVQSFGRYEVSYSSDAKSVNLRRTFIIDNFLFPVSYYSALHLFYDAVRAGDEQEAVLEADPVGHKD